MSCQIIRYVRQTWLHSHEQEFQESYVSWRGTEMGGKLSAGSGRHCEIGILWKSVISWLPSNKQMAEARLQSVKRKLQRDEKFHIQYRQFKLWRTSLTAVTPERWLTKSKNVAFATPWCIHPQTNNKIRVVFDAAAMQDVVSLNHELIALRSSPNQQPAGSSTEV